MVIRGPVALSRIRFRTPSTKSVGPADVAILAKPPAHSRSVSHASLAHGRPTRSVADRGGRQFGVRRLRRAISSVCLQVSILCSAFGSIPPSTTVSKSSCSCGRFSARLVFDFARNPCVAFPNAGLCVVQAFYFYLSISSV